MDPTEMDDAIDAAWDQAMQEERRQLEQMYLTSDPGYHAFLDMINNQLEPLTP